MKPQSLSLEDALENSPQTRCLVQVFAQDASQLRNYMTELHSAGQQLVTAQTSMHLALQQFSHILGSYSFQKFPLEMSENCHFGSLVQKLSGVTSELGNVFELLTEQCSTCVLYPIHKLISNDFNQLAVSQHEYENCSLELEQTIQKQSKISRKDQTKKLSDVNDEYSKNRQKFHDASLSYFKQLNHIQYERYLNVLEPICKLIQAWSSVLHMAHDSMEQPENKVLLSETQTIIDELNTDKQADNEVCANFMSTLAQVRSIQPEMYSAQLQEEPNLHVTQKQGYLFLKQKSALIASWERQYFFTQGGNLMLQGKDDLAGQLLLELNSSVTAIVNENEDRRFTFNVVNAVEKNNFTLQAINAAERDEWIAAINKIGQQGGFLQSNEAVASKTKKKTISSPLKILKNFTNRQHDNNSDTNRLSAAPTETGLRTPPSTPHETFIDTNLSYSAPIQFDLGCLRNSSGDTCDDSKTEEGDGVASPATRVNPFIAQGEATAMSEQFAVKFCGSMQVAGQHGVQIIHKSMNQIASARSTHSIFKMTPFALLLTEKNVILKTVALSDSSPDIVEVFPLENVKLWSNSDNKDHERWFGFILREDEKNDTATDDDSEPKFNCFVFEAQEDGVCGSTVCNSFEKATKLGFESLLLRRTSDLSKDLTFRETRDDNTVSVKVVDNDTDDIK